MTILANKKNAHLLDEPPPLNCAGMHPRLEPAASCYYDECKAIRQKVMYQLQRRLRCPHQLFFCSSTTSAILHLMGYSITAGFDKIHINDMCYPKYESLFGKCFSRYMTTDRNRASLIFSTHVDPVRGDIRPLPPYSGRQLLLVDAAQSLGTAIQSELNAKAPLFVGPLHKHLGLAAGLAIIAVWWEKIPVPLQQTLLAYLQLAEHGTMSLRSLQTAQEMLSTCGAALFNTTALHIGSDLIVALHGLGVEIVTSPGPQLHTIAMRGIRKKIPELFNLWAVGGRYFPEQDILRVSVHSSTLPTKTSAEQYISDRLRRALL